MDYKKREGFKYKKIIYLLSLFMLLLIVFGFYTAKERESLQTITLYTEGNNLSCSLESGFYNKDIEIKLSKNLLLPEDAEILYTLNGDDPIYKGQCYLGPIKINAEEQVKGVTLRAVVRYRNEFTDSLNRTYFVGNEIERRFTYPIISIITDDENLYNYEYGIFVPGITYQNYLNEGGNPKADITLVPCNYNRRGDEWIRNAYLEVFDQNGLILVRQGIGLGVAGGSSAGYDLRSLKIVANELYDVDNSKFYGAFWRNYKERTQYSHNNKFNKIILKSGGQDYIETQMRWDFISVLAEQAGLYPIGGSKKVIVYINGKYYGIMSMSEDRSSYNIAQACGLENEYVEVVSGSEDSCNQNVKDLFLQDLNNESNRNELEAVVDMDQFMTYYAIQVIINNVDWPDNNYALWRYTGNYIEGNEYSDGRYRFLLYDVDLAYLPENHWRKELFGSEVLEKLFSEKGSFIFKNVMKSTYYREKFVNVVYDLLNTTFKTENILNSFDRIYMELSNEIYQYECSKYNNGNNWIESFQKNWSERAKNVRDAVSKRKNYLNAVMEKYFNVGKIYQLSIQIPEESNIICNSIEVCNFDTKLYIGTYRQNCNVKISLKTKKGYSIKYWLVNNIKVFDQELDINSEMITDSKVCVIPILERDNQDANDLVINEISARGSSDWIELCNIAEKEIMLGDYCLTDDIDNLTKYNCPNICLRKNDIVTINGKSNIEMGAYLCNFNLRYGETIYLVHKNSKRIVDSIRIPLMTDEESYGRYAYGESWVFFSNSTKRKSNNYYIE